MSSMENVIRFIVCNNLSGASNAFSELTGMSFERSGKAVEALRPYLDPSYQNPAEASPEPSVTIADTIYAQGVRDVSSNDFKGFPEAIAEPQNQWIVTAISREGGNWVNSSLTYEEAIGYTNTLHNEGYRQIKLGKVYTEPTEAKPEINKWMITAIRPDHTDFWDYRSTQEDALKAAQDLCTDEYKFVSISKVIAEAKNKTVTKYTIEI